jgi:mRNA interferase MazF
MTSDQPARCDVWLARLDPTAGHEQAGDRPVVVISRDAFNAAGWRLCLCVPLSSRDRGSPLHVRIDPPEGGVRATSFALVDRVRALDSSRLQRRWGAVDPGTHRQIAALLLRIVAPR